MKKKYEISFNHTSSKFAASKREAMAMVRTEARVQKRFGKKPRLGHVISSDGEYIYLDDEALNRDADGSRSFAVIQKIHGRP